MIQALQDIMEELSRSALAADADDLQSIADVHTRLGQLQQVLATQPALPKTETLNTSITHNLKMMEECILRESDNAATAISDLQKTVAEIQSIIDSAGTAPAALPDQHPANATADPAISSDDAPLVFEFISEASGHLESAESELLKLDTAPDDSEAINAVFRGFHTIKGVAGFLNLKQIGSLAHAAENLLDLARKGQMQISGVALDLVLESIDAMKRLFSALEHACKQGTPVPVDPTLHSLVERLHAIVTPVEGVFLPAPHEKPPVENLPKTPEIVTQTKVLPPAACETEKSAPISTPASAPASAPTKSENAETIKVSTDRLDKLINAVGELVIGQAMASQDLKRIAASEQRFHRNMSHLGKITRELQDLSMSMRMVPIQGVFQKMSRLVRDLARKAGKDIELHLDGGDTELDRNVVEAISDPLVHMVRNAADHGIETPAERIAAGKPVVGRIDLKARQQGGSIVIEIIDDGKGLRKERILRKAMDAGIVRPDEQLFDQDIFRLIFHAGLSTAEKITDVSGRGVGMDVVRKNVEALRGRIDITSVEGKGSTFTIRLPLTLAIIDGLIVKVGAERFIVPIANIEQSIRPKPEQLATIQTRGELCMVRDHLLPLVRLHRVFNITPTNTDPANALVVIVHDNQRRCCLLVDELLGQQQVVIKSLGRTLGAVPGTSGGAIMGDGCVSLILDVPGIIDLTNLS